MGPPISPTPIYPIVLVIDPVEADGVVVEQLLAIFRR